jgi:peptide/nickel transport system substrate-binding protein
MPIARRSFLLGTGAALMAPRLAMAGVEALIDSPALAAKAAAGELPGLAERLPKSPRVINVAAMGRAPGRHGGTMRMLMGDQRDIRMMTIYGYTRLVVYDEKLELAPDVLESFETEQGRIFTLRLRAGHRWSDGHPLTAEDFRYWWEDVANNKRLSPGGPPQAMLISGQPCRFEVLDEFTLRYSWAEPNPVFLPALAGAQPLYIAMPAHYLKQFHQRYAGKEELEQKVKTTRVKDWGSLHERFSRQYRPENPDLPTLDPWRNTTAIPAERFTFVRNPYFHRIDENGRQLPYADEVTLTIGSSALIPAKTAAGDTDLQARYLRFEDYTFLKSAAKRMNFEVRLWKRAEGASFALMPNLNAIDPVWRDLNRDLRYRRALSLAINRRDINRVIFFGLAKESGNTALPESPLYDEKMAQLYMTPDLAEANRLLDEIGLSKRDSEGIRHFADGRRLEFTVETAGASTEETDILDLIKQDFIAIGIKIHPRSSQLDVFRRRILAGQTIMSGWTGMDNALVAAEMEPDALAPTSPAQFNWPRWGQYFDSGGREGEAPDIAEAKELVELYRSLGDIRRRIRSGARSGRPC